MEHNEWKKQQVATVKWLHKRMTALDKQIDKYEDDPTLDAEWLIVLRKNIARIKENIQVSLGIAIARARKPNDVIPFQRLLDIEKRYKDAEWDKVIVSCPYMSKRGFQVPLSYDWCLKCTENHERHYCSFPRPIEGEMLKASIKRDPPRIWKKRLMRKD